MSFLLRWWWILLVGPVIAGAVAGWSASRSEAEYSSTAKVLVVNELALEANERLINTYAELATVRPMLREVRIRLALQDSEDELTKRVSVTTDFRNQFIHITVRDKDPTKAARIANTLAAVLVEKTATELARPTPTTGGDVGRRSFLLVAEEAQPAAKASKPSTVVNLGLAAALGLLISVSLGILFDSVGWKMHFGFGLPRHRGALRDADQRQSPARSINSGALGSQRPTTQSIQGVLNKGQSKKYGSDWLGDFTNEEVVAIYGQRITDDRGKPFLDDHTQVKDILEKRGTWSTTEILRQLSAVEGNMSSNGLRKEPSETEPMEDLEHPVQG